MDVHEGTEILARLGILESREESPARRKEDAFVDVKFNDDTDSESGGEVVFDRNALVSSRSRRRSGRRSRAACCIFAESSIFAIVIVCSALFTTGFTLNASPNVYNLIQAPSFTLHAVVQTLGLLAGVLFARKLVGVISLTSLITASLVLGLGCTIALLFFKNVPAIAVLFARAFATALTEYSSVSLILAFWRGHRRKLIVLFVCFTLGAMLVPKTAPEHTAHALAEKRNADDLKAGRNVFADANHLLWDWSGEVRLRGGAEGATADWLSVGLTTVTLALLAVTYLSSCRCGVPIDGRVHRLREVEEFTPLSLGFRLRVAALQAVLGAVFTLCEWSRVAAGERTEALTVQMIVLAAALAAGDRLLSLWGLLCLLGLATLTALCSLLALFPSVSHAVLFSASGLSLIYLPLLIDMRVAPRPLLTVDLLVGYPMAARLVLPLALSLAMPKGLLVFALCTAALALMLPLMRSLHKAERVLLAGGGGGQAGHDLEDQRPDPKVLAHRPMTKDDYSALINAMDDSDEESSV